MTFPTFEEFYAAAYPISQGGEPRRPFPWQVRLVDEVLIHGWANLLLDLPTGTGKTSALDVALYCLARAPERMPRRTVLVVDRRIVVDQAAEHARALQRSLAVAERGAARAIADALRSLHGGVRVPFRVAVMRGGMPRDNDWARWPNEPILGVSTVDQVGSRLLFRGYGIHPMSRSIHAGLIGNDTLILLDEVHLSTAFEQTLYALETHRRDDASGMPRRFAVVPMSATVRTPRSEVRRFALDEADRVHRVLRPRLEAHKLARLVAVKVAGDNAERKRTVLARRMVEEALAMQKPGSPVIGIVVNRVDTARQAFNLLTEEYSRLTEAMLITGRMRPLDRDVLVRDRLLPRAGASRTRGDEKPIIIVATQCIEAGADLDLDGIVTECASLDALRQRFGRVDRRGEKGTTQSVILAASDDTVSDANDPIYGRAIACTWQWMSQQAADAVVDFGISWLPAANDEDGRPRLDLLADASLAPVLMPAHLDAWSQTSVEISPDPDVALWLHGPSRSTADVQIVWRSLAFLARRESSHGDGAQAVEPAELVRDMLEAVRPSSLEAVTIPLFAARQWLSGKITDAIADTVASTIPEWSRDVDSPELVAWRWRGTGIAVERVSVVDLRPGDVLVVDVDQGGLRAGSFDPTANESVTDLGDVAQLRSRGIATLRLDRGAVRVWRLPGDPEGGFTRAVDETSRELSVRIGAWFETGVGSDGDVPALVTVADRSKVRVALRRARWTAVGPAPSSMWIATARVPPEKDAPELEVYEAITESSDSSFQSRELTLSRHSDDVRRFAAEFARSLGFADTLARDLALAGWLHDVGKADPRFQRWLVGGDEIRASILDEPLAKSSLDPGNAHGRRLARVRAGYPEGCRHELLSLAMITASESALREATDPELVKHLVASHHGWCRPFASPVDDVDDVQVALVHGDLKLASSTRHRLARLDSGVIDRFWSLTERYGRWGLAWLEAVVRLADHRASELAEDRAASATSKEGA